MISSLANPAVRRARRLKKGRGREREGAYLVEGWRAVEVALGAGAPLRDLFYVRSALERRASVIKEAERAGVPCHQVAAEIMAHLCSTSTAPSVLGVAALPPDERGALAGGAILAGVRDPATAGTVMAAVAATGGRAVAFCGGSVDPFRPKTVRAAGGAHFVLRVLRGLDAAAAADAARGEGARVVALCDDGPAPWDRDLSAPFALVVGAEEGLDAELAARIDERVALPAGRVTPGVGARAAAVLWEAARQRGGTA